MPWRYTIDTDKTVAFTYGSGVLTDEEMFSGVMSLYSDPRFHPDLRGLFDYREAEPLKVSSEMMAKLAAQRRFSETTRTAFLVNSPVAFGLGRVYQAWVAKGQVKITYDRAEAVAWLNEGVPSEKHVT